ncbi:bacteriohemerythrin [Variovorax sp. HJSM1_2]|uniref:bacteriohemerythrin n=1 Tax=Variovorax sp. HJSM1_2 TaxID=3366263 RepID=UPI003BC36DBE
MMNSSDTRVFDWRDTWLVGHAQLDEEHQAFAQLLAALLAAPDDSLAVCLDELISHASAHFAEEDAWMRRLNFPAQQCHMDEHAAVLRSALGVRQRLNGGEIQPARRFAAELAAWFPPHVQHLDSALASWICKQAWNAKPLVFHSRARAVTAAAPSFV